jgi:hypothetical protein
MAESKFDKIFENAPASTAKPVPVEPPPPSPVAELRQIRGGGKTVAGAVRAAEELPPIGPRPLGRPPGKRSDPAWKQFSVLLKKETQRTAANILREQQREQDFSSLVQSLVESWIKRQKT